jgi:hypothetical protein
MDFEANSDVKMMQLNQDNGFLLAENYTQEITILHNPNNFGGNLLCPTNKVGCLVGTGPTAIPVIVDHQAAIYPIQVPASFEELLQNLLFYSGITTILFGPQSALVVGVKTITSTIQSKKIMFKTCVAADAKFQTKFSYDGDQNPTLAGGVSKI